jgi:hypothetical protein
VRARSHGLVQVACSCLYAYAIEEDRETRTLCMVLLVVLLFGEGRS